MSGIRVHTYRMLAAAALMLCGCDPDSDHARDGKTPEVSEELDPISVTLFTPTVELFMEYPPLVVGQKARFLAHLTKLSTGEPVSAGNVTLEARGPAGQNVVVRVDAPKRDALYTPEATFSAPGAYTAVLRVGGPFVEDTIDLGELRVYANVDEARRAAEEDPASEPPNAVPFLMEQQWKIGLKLEQAAKRTLVRRLRIPGQIMPPPGQSAIASPPIAGKLLRPPDGELPRIGERVAAGQLLALVEPPLPATEAAQLSANQAQLHSLELELLLRGTEVERAVAQATVRLDFARRALERATRMREQGLGAERQYEEAEQNLQLAKAESEAALVMKDQVQGARRALDVLRAGLPGGADHPHPSPLPGRERESPGGALQLPVRAPIDGQIVSVSHMEGEHVDAHAEVFRIVNLDRVWVAAQISEFDLAELPETPAAVLTLPAHPGRRFDILADGGRLVNIGTVVDPATRTVPIRYEMPNVGALLRAGMLADVYLETRRAAEVIAVPEAAIVMDTGRPVVFVALEGELFQKREVETGIRDGGYVEMKNGISHGERVATHGAYTVNLASQAPASFGHGHVH